jgi:hypothetical protein
VAEPAALVCANIVCSGLFSTFSNAYGIGADNVVNAEFVGKQGEYFSLNDRSAPNLFAFTKHEASVAGICVKASVKHIQSYLMRRGLNSIW